MKIGTDVSLTTCRNEGYLMMEFKKRELFTKGVLNVDCGVYFFAYYPDYVLEESKGMITKNDKTTDAVWSANDLWEIYLSHKDGIDNCAGMSHEFPSNEYDMLSLASDIDGYCGLNY